MSENTIILVAEDDAGHFELVRKNLWLSCTENEIFHFKDGQQVLDFLFRTGDGEKRKQDQSYILLLDIRMPKVDGQEVLQRIKQDRQLRKIPVIMLTTTDQVSEIDRYYELGCSFYMVKPVNYHRFMRTIENLGAFLSLKGIRVSPINSSV